MTSHVSVQIWQNVSEDTRDIIAKPWDFTTGVILGKWQTLSNIQFLHL